MNPSNGSNLTFSDNQSVPWSVAIDRLNFHKRTCTTFIPKETNRECCVCNYSHSKSDISQLNETWNWKKHTKQEVTNCYGILPPSNSPYLRCDIETEPEQLCFMLFGVWGTGVPGLVMRMIGDTDSTPNIKLAKELLQGISDAALASDAWIITSGYKEESISELIGEVIYNSRIKTPDINFSAIAVGKWGNIHDCHKLEERNLNKQSTISKGHGRYKLEPNHTHYIFFDDSTCDSLDTGEFASNLARQISRGARRRIPLITVLVGGAPHSLPLICTDLEKQIPVVIVNGCGPLADTIYKYLKLTGK